MTSPTVAHDRQLIRALTVVPAAAVILANIIGTGVFVKARVMICNVGTPGMVLTVWVVAGILTLAGALVYAELGTMMPRSGGEFHFVGAGFGRRWAFGDHLLINQYIHGHTDACNRRHRIDHRRLAIV
jgi:APA family basic amino acid/polyamine antiporter